MSDANRARRTAVEVSFDGADMTETIRPYLLSLSYVDNEEGETDDLQIKLQDREGVWLTKWLSNAVEAAATVAAPETPSGGGSAAGAGVYRVTAKSGLNVRAGPGTDYRKVGGLAYGSTVTVKEVSGNWGVVAGGGADGTDGYSSMSYLELVENSGGNTETSTGKGPSTVLKIGCAIVRENRDGDGKDAVLDCGSFELDTVNVSGPPSVVVLKATSLPYTASIRQTEKTRAWEGYTLSRIAGEMAAEGGMACMYEAAEDPYYPRAEQYETDDMEFLLGLCRNAGISLKASNNILILFDQAAYEKKPEVRVIRRGDGSYEKYKLATGSADTLYSSCRVSYTDPATGKSVEGIARVEDYDEESKNNQQLEVTAKAADPDEAKALAEKRLRLHNKFSRTASFTMPGDPALCAGLTVRLEGWGGWDGKYIIRQAAHTVDSGGYTTKIELRRVLEGY